MCGAIPQLSYIPSLERYVINHREFIFFYLVLQMDALAALSLLFKPVFVFV
jgi:hypothetical protein